MMKEKLELIRRHISDSRMTPERKEEVGKLLDELEAELAALPAQTENDIRSLVDIAERATHGVVAPGDPVPLQPLRETVRIFEAAYPNATRLINRFFAMLSGTGI